MFSLSVSLYNILGRAYVVHSLVNNFVAFIGFFNVSYNIDLFNFPFVFLRTVTCF